MHVAMDELSLLTESLQWDSVYGLGLLPCPPSSLKEGSASFALPLIVASQPFTTFGNVLCLIVSLVCYSETPRYVIYLFSLSAIKEEVYLAACHP